MQNRCVDIPGRGGYLDSPVDVALIQRIAIALPALFLSLTVHEYAHARVATWLGDDTPARHGRLTLSPVSHLDPFGSILFPLLLMLVPGGFGIFGWARPVPFTPSRFRRGLSMRLGSALTAVAGPLSNVLLALLALLVTRFVLAAIPGLSSSSSGRMLFEFVQVLYGLNLLLAAFNIFPIPPLDGHYLLPRSLDRVTEFLTRHAFFLFVVLFFVPLLPGGRTIGGLLISPIMSALDTVLRAVASLGA